MNAKLNNICVALSVCALILACTVGADSDEAKVTQQPQIQQPTSAEITGDSTATVAAAADADASVASTGLHLSGLRKRQAIFKRINVPFKWGKRSGVGAPRGSHFDPCFYFFAKIARGDSAGISAYQLSELHKIYENCFNDGGQLYKTAAATVANSNHVASNNDASDHSNNNHNNSDDIVNSDDDDSHELDADELFDDYRPATPRLAAVAAAKERQALLKRNHVPFRWGK